MAPLGPQPEQFHNTGHRPELDREWLGYLGKQGIVPGKRHSLWAPPGIQEAVAHFNAGRYFDSHEQWELLWIRTEYPIRLFYLAMAKLTASFELAKRHRQSAAKRLAEASLNYLAPFQPAFMGIDTEHLSQTVKQWLSRPPAKAARQKLRIFPSGHGPKSVSKV